MFVATERKLVLLKGEGIQLEDSFIGSENNIAL